MRHQFDGTSSEHPVGESLVDLLRRRASTSGDKQAFCFLAGDGSSEATITYRQLDERAMAIAAHLQSMAPRGARALLVFPPGLDFIAGSSAASMRESWLCRWPRRPQSLRLSAEPIVEASNPFLVLSTARHQEEAEASNAPRALLERRWVAIDEIPSEARSAWQDPRVDGRHLAFLQYTSGSTSAPKGSCLVIAI